MSRQKLDDFEHITRPVIKWLNDNGHPHMSILIEPTRATLREDLIGFPTLDYLKD